MSGSYEKKKVNIYNLKEVREWCTYLNCTPYDLFVAYKKVGDSVTDLKSYIECEILVKNNASRIGV
ncbi:MAG: DUF3606 domain-containing protein [Candidatus Delongbacteria bacterium]|nr:DUF3606 domain-containing protein [Candidatus Delongbacteria bacterium]MCG2759689.1 DUF3606 domain-containing protein [Candidatus Delongbacteria bacterium]